MKWHLPKTISWQRICPTQEFIRVSSVSTSVLSCLSAASSDSHGFCLLVSFSGNIFFCWVPGTPLMSWTPQDAKAGCWDLVTWRGIPQSPYHGTLLDANHCCTCLQNFWWLVHAGFRLCLTDYRDLEALELGPPCSAYALSSEWVSFQAQLRGSAMGLPCQIFQLQHPSWRRGWDSSWSFTFTFQYKKRGEK